MKTLLILILSVNGIPVSIQASYGTEYDCTSAVQLIQSTEEYEVVDAYCVEPNSGTTEG